MNEVIKLAFVDDDNTTRKILIEKSKELFLKHCFSCDIKQFDNGESYIASLEKEKYHFTFLDIEMPEINGIQVAATIRSNPNVGRFVFVSNREDLVFKSLATKPYGFVRKSHFINDITNIIRFYVQEIEQEGKMILSISSHGNITKINVKDIVYIEAFGKKQEIHLNNEKEPLIISISLKDIVKKLNSFSFVEVYKGIVVNCQFIEAISSEHVLLVSGEKLLLSRRKNTDVKKAYLKYINFTKAL